MKEHPILFSAPMVRALLAGTKTQTRRVVKQAITGPNPPTGIFDWHHPKTGAWLGAHGGGIEFGLTNAARLCPYGQPGDRLWVREAHWMDRRDTTLAVMNVDGFVVAQNGRETGQESSPEELALNPYWKIRPSIHMPRWASRILLEIVSVRVERLQDISDQDALAEGVSPDMGLRWQSGDDTPRGVYGELWESINGPGSWDANPWVWVVEFKRIEVQS